MYWKEVGKCRPIPCGGWKLFATILLCAIIPVILVLDFQETVFGRLIGISAVVIVTGALLMGRYSAVPWLRDYWRQNIRGYNAWYWRDRDWQEGKGAAVVTQRGDGCEKTSLFGPERSVVKIPLGGWFNSSGRVHDCNKTGEIKRSRGWRLKRLDWCMDGMPRFFVSDGYGEGFTLALSDFLDFLEWDCGSDNWSVLTRMLREGLQFRRERDEAKLEASQLRGELTATATEREFALSAIHTAIVAIGKTSRFGKSKEAKRIREELTSGLLAALPQYEHPLKRIYGRPDSQPAAAAAVEAQAGG